MFQPRGKMNLEYFGNLIKKINEKTFRDRGSGLQDYLGQTSNILATKEIKQEMRNFEQRKRK